MPLLLTLFLSSLLLASSHEWFVPMLPNGARVPKVAAVGHLNPKGGGDTNPFGGDFGDNNEVYSSALCALDSDGDGQSNGFELGDSCCLWMNSSMDHLLETVSLSNPGDATYMSTRPPCFCNGTAPYCKCCSPDPSPEPTPAPQPLATPLLSVPLLAATLALAAAAGAGAAWRILAQRKTSSAQPEFSAGPTTYYMEIN
jgi:hypothetical protein